MKLFDEDMVDDADGDVTEPFLISNYSILRSVIDYGDISLDDLKPGMLVDVYEGGVWHRVFVMDTDPFKGFVINTEACVDIVRISKGDNGEPEFTTVAEKADPTDLAFSECGIKEFDLVFFCDSYTNENITTMLPGMDVEDPYGMYIVARNMGDYIELKQQEKDDEDDELDEEDLEEIRKAREEYWKDEFDFIPASNILPYAENLLKAAQFANIIIAKYEAGNSQ